MNLGGDKTLFQYLAIEYLDIHIVQSHLLEACLGQGVDPCGLQRLYLQLCGFLFEQALYTHDDSALDGDMLGELLAVLEVELARHTLGYIQEFSAYIALGQYHLSLQVFARYQNTLQNIQFSMGHCTVFTCQLTGYVTC